MNQISKNEAILFACCDSLYWGCVACFLGFAGCFFLDCGMASSVLSLVIAAYQLLALGGGFFWGGLCDRLETNRKIFIPVFAGYLVCMSLTYYFVTYVLLRYEKSSSGLCAVFCSRVSHCLDGDKSRCLDSALGSL